MKISKVAAKSLRLKSKQYGINYEKLQSVYEQGLNEYFVNSPENISLSSFAMSKVNTFLKKI
jgi:hypothetical protein